MSDIRESYPPNLPLWIFSYLKAAHHWTSQSGHMRRNVSIVGISGEWGQTQGCSSVFFAAKFAVPCSSTSQTWTQTPVSMTWTTERPRNIALVRTSKNSVGTIKMKTVRVGKVTRTEVGCRGSTQGAGCGVSVRSQAPSPCYRKNCLGI